jgi:hypothetical protein
VLTHFLSSFSEYIPDPELPALKSGTVKTVIMLVFREGKSPEEELKAWQFWHSRQHSVKQRILDADTKNSLGELLMQFSYLFQLTSCHVGHAGTHLITEVERRLAQFVLG